MSGVVWSPSSGHGLKTYLGLAPSDGLEWDRHGPFCKPGFWAVRVTGWSRMESIAVVNDFGDLVQVKGAKVLP